ncbi:toll/interleukin-1 receptor domain-containing protein [Flavobacterium chungangensis]|uniref:Toll/interleukin-1 receptor domain-containing protein n=1 Tax=Flavobacterium chungangensis TaxID=2708132 RepID=A0ABV8ZHV8_9FLAO
MKAFISYRFTDNISEIVKLLNENKIEVYDSLSDIDYGSSIQKSIKRAISECDFVILVYSLENPHIAFEAGIAFSLNKPIFSIISEYKEDPVFLFDSPYVRALPTEIEKISFNLKIFLDKIKPKKREKKIIQHKYYKGDSLNYYNDIFYNYNNLNTNNEREYEIFFKDIFEKYSLNVIQNKFDSKSNFYTDFCIWSDELSNVLGNPILIEIKKEINKKNIGEIESNVNNLIKNNFAECCLIFYDNLKGIEKKELPNTLNYYFIQISDFIEKLISNDFNESIRKIRNEIVHNHY